jgi:hypothetical protein
MAFVLKDCYVQIDSVDLTTDGASVEVSMAADDVDVSTFGAGVHQHLGGLRADQFVITFLSNFDANRVDDTLFPLLATADQTPEFTVRVGAFGSIPSATNPHYVSTRCILLNYSPLAGDIGARSETQVTIPSNELITRDTT